MDDAAKAAPDWAAVREEYEGRLFLPKTICQRHGLTISQLRYRRHVEGWLSMRARVPRQDDILARMLKVLDKQLKQLEAAVGEPIDKQVKALADSVRTYDILIKQGAAKPNAEPASRKDEADLRAKLVRRMEQFKARE